MSRLYRLFDDPLSLLYTLPAILIGLTVHEWAHAYAAYRLGDPTARNMGRMTLNPFAHIDLYGFLCLLLLGFGWAKPVPVNPRNFKNFKRDDTIVSLAGITANLITAFVFTVLYCFGFAKTGLGRNEAFLTIFQSIIVINLSLMLFNLIPIYPLDGSHVFETLAGHRMPRAVLFLRQYGRYILIVLLLTGAVGRVLGTLVSFLFSWMVRLAMRLVFLF